MKKKLLFLLSITLLMAGCKSTIDYHPSSLYPTTSEVISESSNSSEDNNITISLDKDTSSDSATSEEIKDKKTEYVVIIKKEQEEDGYQEVVTDVTVNYYDKDGEKQDSSKVDSFGESASELGGDNYYVQVDNIPDGYTYNPNTTTIDKDNNELEITVHEIRKWAGKGNGTKYQEALKDENGEYILDENGYGQFVGGPLEMDDLGIYEVNITEEVLSSAEPYLYIALDAPWAGDFTIESWYDYTITSPDIEFDPRIEYMGANFAYIVNVLDKDDNSGEGKNFKIDRSVQPSLVGNACQYFRVTANKPGKFCISLTGIKSDIQEEIPDTFIPAEREHEFGNEIWETGKLTSIRMDGEHMAVFNYNDGFYHLDRPTGPVIYARLSQPCEFLDLAINAIQGQGNRYLSVPIDLEKNLYKDYTDFINDYCRNTNADGCYPMTEELAEFFDLVNQREWYFVNKPEQNLVGWIREQIDYEPDEDCEWLWAAYYYEG